MEFVIFLNNTLYFFPAPGKALSSEIILTTKQKSPSEKFKRLHFLYFSMPDSHSTKNLKKRQKKNF